MDLLTQIQELIPIFIGERIMILVPVNIVLFKMLKNIPKLPEWLIPWLLLMVSFGLTILFNLQDEDFAGLILRSTIQAVLVVGLAFYLQKRFIEKK